jgi:trigger factor
MRNATSLENAASPDDGVVERVLAAYEIEVPQALVDEEVTMMVLELNHKMKYDGLATGAYTSLTEDEKTERLETFRKEAFKTVKTRLVLRSIIEAEHLDVTREELEGEARAISVRQGMPMEMVKDFLGADLAPLKEDLLMRKAFDSINAKA